MFFFQTNQFFFFLLLVNLPSIPALPCSIPFENCQQCDIESKCINCNSGYALYLGSCIPCSSKIANCRVCKSDGSIDRCYDCLSNYRPTTTSYPDDTCSNCDSSSCGTCNQYNCLNCELGYYLNPYVKCASCKIECATCSSYGKCLSCKEGYYLYLVDCIKCEQNDQNVYANCLIKSGNSKLCNSPVKNCLECNTQNICINCVDGYYLSSNICKSCGEVFPLCGKCRFEKEVLKCLECQSGNYFPFTERKDNYYWFWDYSFFLGSDSTRCVPCPNDLCSECRGDSPSACLSCITGFYLWMYQCYSCRFECESCYSYNQCTKCKSGYYRNEGLCIKCSEHDQRSTCIIDSNQIASCKSIDNCFTCNEGSAECQNCVQGYFINVGSCKICGEIFNNCRLCNEFKCLDCLEGFAFYGNYINCYRIENENCIQGYRYNTWDSLIQNSIYRWMCVACLDGFWLQSGNCFPCMEGCSKCLSYFKCNDCKDGYYMEGNFCKKCKTQSPICEKCDVSYFLNIVDGFCHSCTGFVSNCLNCDQSECKSCSDGYYLNSPYFCAPCNFQTTERAECLSVKLPKSCIDHCVNCDTNNKCLNCENGFYLNNDKCEDCSQTVSNCFSCTKWGGIFTCNSCNKGYYFPLSYGYSTYSLDTSKCFSCNKKGCDQCDSYDPNRCNICSPGYYKVTGNNYYYNYYDNCIPCPFGCKACTSNQLCTICEKGYYLDGICKFCPESNCEICNQFDPSKCLKCKNSYFLENQQCQKCPKNLSNTCETCSSDGKCLTCLDGYLLSSDQCLTCPLNCIKCLDKTTCKTCQEGYFLSASQVCTRCGANCNRCDDASSCAICDIGYILESFSCVSCIEATTCLDCAQNGVCLLCQPGYGLTDIGTCAITPSGLTNCMYLDSNNHNNCKVCQPDYYLKNQNQCSKMSPECLKKFNDYLNVIKISHWCDPDIKNLYATINLLSNPIFLSANCFSISAYLQNDRTKLYNKISNATLTQDNKIFHININLSEIQTAPCKKLIKTDFDIYICSLRVFLNYEEIPQASYEFEMNVNLYKTTTVGNLTKEISFFAYMENIQKECKQNCVVNYSPNSTLALCQDIECKTIRTTLSYKRNEKMIFKQMLTDQLLLNQYYLDLYSIRFSSRVISNFDMSSICNVTRKAGLSIFECSIPFADNGEGSKIVVTSLLVNSVDKRLLAENITGNTTGEYSNKAIANAFDILVSNEEGSYGVRRGGLIIALAVVLLFVLVSV